MIRKIILSGLVLFLGEMADAKPVKPVILVFRTMPPTSEELAYIEQVNPVGFLLFAKELKGPVSPLSVKRDIEKRLNRKVYFFADQEGGTVNRLPGSYPSAAAFQKMYAEHPEKAVSSMRQTAFEMGTALKQKGVDAVFAPVLDVSASNLTAGETDFLKNRTFGTDPETVSILAGAFIDGMTQAGIQTCPKHAPGIGRSRFDPHENKARISTPLDELKAHDVQPFYRHADSCLMTGHIFYKAIDDDTVSTFSPTFYQWIRRELNFNGWIIPDALNMQGLGTGTPAEKMTRALTAGADVVMPFFGPDVSFQERQKAIEALPESVIIRFQNKNPETGALFDRKTVSDMSR